MANLTDWLGDVIPRSYAASYGLAAAHGYDFEGLRTCFPSGGILDDPEPFVWFTDFADNSLNFEVQFWVKVRSIADRSRIESDVRYRIDQLFREARITIAFPQRDIHIDASTPIPIRVLPSEAQDYPTTMDESEAA